MQPILQMSRTPVDTCSCIDFLIDLEYVTALHLFISAFCNLWDSRLLWVREELVSSSSVAGVEANERIQTVRTVFL